MLLERYAAFSTTAGGGNPAGVVLDAAGIDAAAMQAYQGSDMGRPSVIRVQVPQDHACGIGVSGTAIALP
jgi:predicted PhzF superfamily epimerase YddE/YHI9